MFEYIHYDDITDVIESPLVTLDCASIEALIDEFFGEDDDD